MTDARLASEVVVVVEAEDSAARLAAESVGVVVSSASDSRVAQVSVVVLMEVSTSQLAMTPFLQTEQQFFGPTVTISQVIVQPYVDSAYSTFQPVLRYIVASPFYDAAPVIYAPEVPQEVGQPLLQITPSIFSFVVTRIGNIEIDYLAAGATVYAQTVYFPPQSVSQQFLSIGVTAYAQSLAYRVVQPLITASAEVYQFNVASQVIEVNVALLGPVFYDPIVAPDQIILHNMLNIIPVLYPHDVGDDDWVMAWILTPTWIPIDVVEE